MRSFGFFFILSTSLAMTACQPQSQKVNDTKNNSQSTIQAPSSPTTHKKNANSEEKQNHLLGLPPVPIPANNPMSDAKIALGETLYNDTRFSADGKVSCATCHDPTKGFTDNLKTSKGFMGKTGTRNAPTVINAAYNKTQFWDGRRPDLEGQSMDPPLNPVEGGLGSHDEILEVIRKDADYVKAFKSVFGKQANDVSMTEVSRAIAAFERTIIGGNSDFDRYYFGGDKKAMSEAAIRGFELFTSKARCVDCHTIDQETAIFTDHKFHNLGIGFERIEKNLDKTAGEMIARTRAGENVDDIVLSDGNASELGRFAITGEWQDIGQFKTPTLRNIELTAPYMHDGSLATLEDVITFYNDTIAPGQKGEPNPFQSGGIKPLNLTDQEKADLVTFLKSLTSPQFVQ